MNCRRFHHTLPFQSSKEHRDLAPSRGGLLSDLNIVDTADNARHGKTVTVLVVAPIPVSATATPSGSRDRP